MIMHHKSKTMIRPTAATLFFGMVVLAGGAAIAAFNLPSISNDAGIVADRPAASTSAINRRNFAKLVTAAATAATVLPGADIAAADNNAANPYADFVTSESGMRYLITKEGDGAVPSVGQL